MKKSILVLSSILFLSSCVGLHSGVLNNSTSLQSANFSYASKNVSGSSTATYILGIGGLAKDNLIAEAKRHLIESAGLKDNQALANTTVSFKKSNFIGVYITVKCTVTADIVQFNSN